MLQLSRRGLIGMLAAGVGAVIVRPGLIMPIKPALVQRPRFSLFDDYAEVDRALVEQYVEQIASMLTQPNQVLQNMPWVKAIDWPSMGLA